MTDAAQELPPGSVIAGRYRVDRCVGRGGMGAVYLVRHVNTDERLALKVLHATVLANAMAVERFRREARAPAQIDSDHVVRVTDADTAPELGGAPFLVMEFLKGQDLEHEVEQHGALPPERVVLYLKQAARALDKAHSLGIVHRDLKPENLFLAQREDGTPCIKILDFGIAKITGGSAQSLQGSGKTETGTITGTPMYMSPEQIMGKNSEITGATDVWAFGLIALRLLSGAQYWTAETLPMLVAQIAYEPLVPPSARGLMFGPALDAWFATCCARDPAQRFKTAGEAATALEQALGLGGAPRLSNPHVGYTALAQTAVPTSGPAPLAGSLQGASVSMAGAQAVAGVPAAKKGRGAWLGAIAAVLVLGAGGAIVFISKKQPQQPATSSVSNPPPPQPSTVSSSVMPPTSLAQVTDTQTAATSPHGQQPRVPHSGPHAVADAGASVVTPPPPPPPPPPPSASHTGTNPPRPNDNDLLNVQHP